MERKETNRKPGHYLKRIKISEGEYCTLEIEEELGKIIENKMLVCWLPLVILNNIPQERKKLEPTTSQAVSQIEGN